MQNKENKDFDLLDFSDIGATNLSYGPI